MYKTDKTLRDKYDTNANYKRWNYRLNVDIDITPTTVLKLGVSGDLNKRNSPGLGDDRVWGQLFGYNNILSPVMYSNGYVPQINIGRDDNHVNPWVSATQTGYNEEWTNNLYSNASLEQNLDFVTKGLKFTARFGYDTYNFNKISHMRSPATYHANGRDDNGNIIWDQIRNESDMTQSSSNEGSRREFIELLLNYNRQFAKVHNVGANFRFTQDTNIQTQNLGNDIKNSVSRKNMALAGQVTYNYANRYFIDGNFGYNGTENFADGHRWGFFPAFSVAWNVAEEPWVRKVAPWMDMFKIRYSYGKVGNDAIMDGGTRVRFPYLYTLDYLTHTDDNGNIVKDNIYNFGTSSYTNIFNGIHYAQLAAQGVTWEVARKSDVGIDLVLFNNKFSMTVDYFYEKRTGQYSKRNFIPSMAGFESSPWANVGAVRVNGFDGNFSYNQKFGEVDLTVRGNITYSKNEVLVADEQFNTYPYQYAAGYRVNQQKGLIALGLFKDWEDIRNSPEQTFGDYMPGDIKYKDVNGDGEITTADRTMIGNPTPDVTYGFTLGLGYKNWDLAVDMMGQGGNQIYRTWDNYNWSQFNFRGKRRDRWQGEGTSNTQPLLNPKHTINNLHSEYYIEDDSFFRIRNVSLAYNFDKALISKIGMQALKLYVNIQNLKTWKHNTGYTPELGGSAIAFGVDDGSYPMPAIYTFGFNLTF